MKLYNDYLASKDKKNLQQTTTIPQNQYWDWVNNKPNSQYGYTVGANTKRRIKQ